MAKVAFKTSDDINLFLGKKYLVNGEDVTVASQSGNSGKYLTTDGSSTSWIDLPFNYAVETTISTTSATEIDSIDISTFTGAEFIVSLKQGSKIRTSKVIMQTDGTNVDMSEYAIVETGGLINGVDISVAAESGNAVLKAAASDANITNVAATVLRINGEQGLSGVVTTSGVQTLTNKTLASPTFTGTFSLPNTTSIGSVSSTELGYLDGVTSAIQTQINGKAASIHTHAQSDITNLTTDLAAKANLSGATFTGAVSGTDLTLSGNLIVNGTTTNINSTNLVVEDKNIVLGDTTSPTDISADGGGITLKGTTDKTFNWVDSTDAWTSSEHINLASGKSYKINNIAISASLPALTWGDFKNGKSGLTIS